MRVEEFDGLLLLSGVPSEQPDEQLEPLSPLASQSPMLASPSGILAGVRLERYQCQLAPGSPAPAVCKQPASPSPPAAKQPVAPSPPAAKQAAAPSPPEAKQPAAPSPPAAKLPAPSVDLLDPVYCGLKPFDSKSETSTAEGSSCDWWLPAAGASNLTRSSTKNEDSPTPESLTFGADAGDSCVKPKRRKYGLFEIGASESTAETTQAVTNNAHLLLGALGTDSTDDLREQDQEAGALLSEQRKSLAVIQKVSTNAQHVMQELEGLRSLVSDPALAVTIVNLALCHKC